MSSRLFDYDRSTYVLESLKLDVEGLEDPRLTDSTGIGSFKDHQAISTHLDWRKKMSHLSLWQ
jgi:hypothetical protein